MSGPLKDAPKCPLCLQPMVRVNLPPIKVGGEIISRWVCHKDKVGIDVRDPLVGKWDMKSEEKIACPTCGTQMRMFATTAGFMRADCPKCHTSIKAGLPFDEGPGTGCLPGMATVATGRPMDAKDDKGKKK